MSEAFDDYRNLVADRDQLLEHNAELRARVAELVEACNIRTNELHRIAGLLGVEPNADAINAALAKREAVAGGVVWQARARGCSEWSDVGAEHAERLRICSRLVRAVVVVSPESDIPIAERAILAAKEKGQ